MKTNKGATFLEVVVTLAVIGFVSYIIIFSLGSAKDNVRINDIQASLNTLVATALACVDSGKEINEAYAGDKVCESAILSWPILTDDWKYSTTTSSLPTATFSYGAGSVLDKKEIKCNQKGCSITSSL